MCLDELSVADFFVLFLLSFDDSHLFFLKDFHASLLKSAFTKDVEHGLNFGIEIEQLWITIVNLSRLAAVCRWHARVEQWYRRPVKIEFCEDTLL